MKSNERSVNFFELFIDTNKKAASPPSLARVVEQIRRAFENGDAILDINKNTATIEIADFRVDEHRKLVTMLLRYSDKNGADVYFSNPATGQSRTERKKSGEGRGFGAHLCISLQQETGRPNLYFALLEKVTGINSTFVIRLLQSIIRKMYQEDENLFTCDDISGARDRAGHPKQVGFRPMLELRGLPSDQFISDLESGTLKEIHLIQDKEGHQFGARPWLSERQHVVRLTAKQGVPGVDRLWSSLTSLFAREATENGFDRARINFTRSDGQPDTVEVDAETGSLLNQRYVKAKKIPDIDPPLDECSDDIVEHFAALIEDEVIANRR